MIEKQAWSLHTLRWCVTHMMTHRLASGIQNWRTKSRRAWQCLRQLEQKIAMNSQQFLTGALLLRNVCTYITKGEIGLRLAVWRSLSSSAKEGQTMIRLVCDFSKGLGLRLLRQAFVYITRNAISALVINWRCNLHVGSCDADLERCHDCRNVKFAQRFTSLQAQLSLQDLIKCFCSWREHVIIDKYTHEAIKQTMLDTRTVLKGQMVTQMSRLRQHMVTEQKAVAMRTFNWVLTRWWQRNLVDCVTAWRQMWISHKFDLIEAKAEEKVAQAEEKVILARMKVVALEERFQDALNSITIQTQEEVLSLLQEGIMVRVGLQIKEEEVDVLRLRLAEADERVCEAEEKAAQAAEKTALARRQVVAAEERLQHALNRVTTLSQAEILFWLQSEIREHVACTSNP